MTTPEQVIQLSSRLGYSLSRQSQVFPGLVLTWELDLNLTRKTVSLLLPTVVRNCGRSGVWNAAQPYIAHSWHLKVAMFLGTD
jgi:hypothetical protein